MSKISLKPRLLAAALTSAAIFLPAIQASAADYPSRNIQLIVPWAPGGGADNFARALQPGVEKVLGQKLIIKNINGGGGAVGFMQGAAARPNGYTASVSTNALFTLQGMGHVPVKYEQFDFVARVFSEPYVLAARSDGGWTNLKAFTAAAGSKPKSIKVAFSGIGSSTHVVAALAGSTLGVEFELVPYQGGSAAVAAAMGGHIDAVMLNPSEVVSAVGSGKLTALAVTGEERSGALPETPTMKESGYDMVIEQWRGIALPKGVDPEVVAVWEDAIKAAVKDPKFLQTAKNMGSDVRPLYGDELDAFVERTAQVMIEESAKLK